MQRYRGLDGLRGLAALAVLFGHVMMTDAGFAGTWAGQSVSGWRSWLAYSPAHVVWAGAEAVDIFFVLSGFVLVLPFLDRPVSDRWIGYFPQRITRLALPIWAAVGFAVLCASLIPRSAQASSAWLSAHAGAVTTGNIRQSLEIVRGANGLNTALWSMQWEMVFSLVLPAYVLVAVLTRRGWWLGALLAMVASGVGVQHGSQALQYLAMFAVGSCLAAGRSAWEPWCARLTRTRAYAAAIVALLLVNARWTTAGTATTTHWAPWLDSLTLLGAAVLVCLLVAARPVIAIGTSRVAGFLGKISFSLYLVHEPIVVSIGQAHLGLGWTMLLAVPVSLAAGALFYSVIERPGHVLSGRVARVASRSWSTR